MAEDDYVPEDGSPAKQIIDLFPDAPLVLVPRTCMTCGRTKPIEEFAVNQGYRLNRCLECQKERNRIKSRDYHSRNVEAAKVRMKAARAKNFQRILDHYGNECACCGETERLFLTVDHINNDGNEHRKKDPTGRATIYRWLINRGFPPGFQILCMNCNQGKHRNGGICPHKGIVHKVVEQGAPLPQADYDAVVCNTTLMFAPVRYADTASEKAAHSSL
jgi:hypothetical protein